jgi:hypothetical protein
MALILNEAYTNNIQPCPNVWVNTTCANLATYGSKKRGAFYEDILTMILKEQGYDVINAESSTAPYDRIIISFNSKVCRIKVEIKVALSATDYKNRCVDNYNCIFNHIALGKEFDIIMFMCIIKKDGVAMYELRWCTREELTGHIKSEDSLFCKQQGGKKANNDDYMCGGKTKTKELLSNQLFKKLDLLELYIRDDKL